MYDREGVPTAFRSVSSSGVVLVEGNLSYCAVGQCNDIGRTHYLVFVSASGPPELSRLDSFHKFPIRVFQSGLAATDYRTDEPRPTPLKASVEEILSTRWQGNDDA